MIEIFAEKAFTLVTLIERTRHLRKNGAQIKVVKVHVCARVEHEATRVRVAEVVGVEQGRRAARVVEVDQVSDG